MTCPACRYTNKFSLHYRRDIVFAETPEIRADPEAGDCTCVACGHSGPLFMFSPVFEEDPYLDRNSFAVEPDALISTYGGESWIGDFEINDYGINIGDVCVHGLTSDQMARLAAAIVDHVSVCGHEFRLEKRRGISNEVRTVLECGDIRVGRDQ